MSLIKKHQISAKSLIISIVLNGFITAAQVVGGVLSGSLALISDAVHNFSDVLSLAISLFAHKIAQKKASNAQTFGYKRAEIMAAFLNALSLLVLALFLVYEAIKKIFEPQVVNAPVVIWLALLGIIVNGLSVLLLKKDASHNLNIKSAYVHLFSDMLSSIAILIGGAMMYYFKTFWIDSMLTMLIATYLIYISKGLLTKSFKILMLFTPENINIKEVVREVHQIKGVRKLHHIHVWLLSEDEIHLEAHLDCTEDMTLSEFNLLLQNIEMLLFNKFGINHINIQPEFQKEDPKEFIVQD